MRTLVIGDIHGAYKALLQVLEKAKVTPDDFLIFLGDIADRWSETPKVYDLLIEMQKTHKILMIKGNHDDLCYQFLSKKPMDSKWLIHGGDATQKAYENIPNEVKQKHMDFIHSMKNYVVDGQNRLFLHGGFTNLRGVEFEYWVPNFFWDRTLWELAISTPEDMPKEDIFYPKRLKLYKEIYIGHTPLTRFNTDQPMMRHNVWNIDTGAGFHGRITILDVDTKEYWQSDPVPSFYPNEKVRDC
ncbi:MAG: metallophosphoesterase [Capnocytophaga sp.]|nr:metallophosphoesterase [Capnocytophaga sp.]